MSIPTTAATTAISRVIGIAEINSRIALPMAEGLKIFSMIYHLLQKIPADAIQVFQQGWVINLPERNRHQNKLHSSLKAYRQL